MWQMFDKTCNKMINRRWEKPRAFGDQVDRSNPQKTSSGKFMYTGEHSSWYRINDFSTKVEGPCCQQSKPGDILAVGPLDWDEIIEEDYDNENGVGPGPWNHGRSGGRDDKVNDGSERKVDRQCSQKGSRKGKGTKDGIGTGKRKATDKGKGKWKRNGKATGIVVTKPRRR